VCFSHLLHVCYLLRPSHPPSRLIMFDEDYKSWRLSLRQLLNHLMKITNFEDLLCFKFFTIWWRLQMMKTFAASTSSPFDEDYKFWRFSLRQLHHHLMKITNNENPHRVSFFSLLLFPSP
jgi:hypothetical protein